MRANRTLRFISITSTLFFQHFFLLFLKTSNILRLFYLNKYYFTFFTQSLTVNVFSVTHQRSFSYFFLCCCVFLSFENKNWRQHSDDDDDVRLKQHAIKNKKKTFSSSLPTFVHINFSHTLLC
jgi:hypothetical protein